jgi:predicted GTPase
MGKSIYELLSDEIMDSELPEDEKNRRLSSLIKAGSRKINLLIVGATGVGKSSTINSMFNTKIAQVGVGADSETASVERYDLENLTIWDTPGLGNGAEKGAITGGCILGIPGMVAGGLLGAIAGGLYGLIIKPIMEDVA